MRHIDTSHASKHSKLMTGRPYEAIDAAVPRSSHAYPNATLRDASHKKLVMTVSQPTRPVQILPTAIKT